MRIRTGYVRPSGLSLASFGYRMKRGRLGSSYAHFADDTDSSGGPDCVSGSTPDINGNCCPITQMNTDGTCGAGGSTGTANLSVQPQPASAQSVTGGGTAASATSVGTGGSTWTQALPGILQSTLGITGAVLGVGAKPVAKALPKPAGMGVGTMLIIGLIGVAVVGGIAYEALKD
jgi:hypothetical protein